MVSLQRPRLNLLASSLLFFNASCVALAQPIDIETRLTQLQSDPAATFGTAPTDDFAAIPANTLALVSWNIQIGGTSPNSSAKRPPQVEKALDEILDGSYHLLVAQEISSTKHSDKLTTMLPGTGWSASFADTTSTMDNGFWFQNGVAVERDDVILHTWTLDSKGRIIKDDDLAKHPPRIGHFTVGDFDFLLISVHLTFQDGETAKSVGELEHILDFLDIYFDTAGHDPDVIIAGDFNVPSDLSGQTGEDDIVIDSVFGEDPRFQTGDRRFVVTVHEPTSRSTSGASKGQPKNNYDHFILSVDCLEELVRARRMNTALLLDNSDEVQPDGTRRLTSDHFPIVAFFRTSGTGVSRDLP